MLNREVNIPDQIKGLWEIKTKVVSEIGMLRSLMNYRNVPLRKGQEIKILSVYNGGFGYEIVMSNTPDEIIDHIPFVNIAEGDVLITGLGLGIVVNMLLEKQDINSITVIEKHKDVIDMVEPYILHPKLKIMHGDAFNMKLPKYVRFHYAWHDIWYNISGANVKEMDRLKVRFKKHIIKKQMFWCRKECIRANK